MKIVFRIALSVILAGYCLAGLLSNDLAIPVRRYGIVRYHGFTVVLMFLAALCAAASMSFGIADDLRKAGSESDYGAYSRILGGIGRGFFGLSLVAIVYHGMNK